METQENVRNVFSGMLVGLILFVGSFFLLWFNEAGYVKSLQKADYIQKNVISISKYSPEYNRKLVHYTGRVKTNDTVSDDFVSVNTPALKKTVEMYQWDERCRSSKSGSHRTKSCSYTKKWSDKQINSTSFKERGHDNPTMAFKSDEFFANNVLVDDFRLDPELIKKLNPEIALTNLPSKQGYQTYSGYYYSGTDFSSPQIGDYRISYQYMPINSSVSIIAAQYNKIFYEFSNNKYDIALLYNGIHSADGMVNIFKENAKMLLYILRILGFILMVAGLKLLISPLSIIFSFIPIIGDIAEYFTGFVCFLIALALSLITIAVAWIAVRPLISIPLIIISIFGIVFVFTRKQAVN